MVKAMKVATGIEEEEYENGKPKQPAKSSSEDELEDKSDHLQVAAMRIADPAEKTKSKKKKKP